jgi:hypothetical protein
MKEEKLKPIKLHGSVVEELFRSEYDEMEGSSWDDEENEDEYKGWYVTADESTGDFDSAKSAMVDFDIELYDNKGNHRGTANGGYYIQGDYSFDFGSETFYTFIPAPAATPLSLFNEFLEDLANDSSGLKSKITKIKKYLVKLEK